MSIQSIVQGTLKADGTLELDQQPNLLPGRVQVTVEFVAQPLSAKKRGLADVIDEIQQAQQARGYQGRTKEQWDADEAARRAEEDDYE
jgi:hypothetical protein